MSYFNLPASTIVNRFIPKNAFDDYTNTKQKKKFVERPKSGSTGVFIPKPNKPSVFITK